MARAAIDGHWWRTRRGMALLLVGAAVPLLLPSQPWLADLPAHISRYHIQEALGRSPALARHFDFEWRYIPNLGVDLLVVPLSPLFGLMNAVRIIVAAIPVLTILGLMWIAREVHGRVQPIHLFALPLAFAYPLTFGFVNSCLSTAFALIVFAGWLRLGRQRREGARAVMLAIASPMVLTAHITGFGVLGVLVGGAAFADCLTRRLHWRAVVWRMAVAVAPVAWPLLLLAIWHTGGDAVVSGWFDWSLDAIWIVSLLRERYAVVDIAAAVVIYLVAALPLLFRSRYGYSLQLALPAAIIGLLSLTMPSTMMGSIYASVRLLPTACALAIVAIGEKRPSPRWVAPVALILFASRLLCVTISQLSIDHIASRRLTALDHVAPGSRIAAMQVEPCNRSWPLQRLSHLASVATLRRDAYVNDQFVATTGQLLSLRPAVVPALATMPSQVMLERACRRSWPVMADVLARVPWASTDYLWIVSGSPGRIGPRYPVRLIWANGDAQLYEVVKSGA